MNLGVEVSMRSRCVFGTVFVQHGPAKFWKRKFSKGMGATQRLRRNAGSQKSWEISWIRDVSLEPSFANLARENFGNKNFSETWAPRRVRSRTRGTKSCGKFPGFAVCLWNLLRPTWPAKILETEIFEKHGHHAALEARRGEPKILQN